MNEEFDDGIMSAINFHVHLDKKKGTDGEDRVVRMIGLILMM